MVRKKKGEGGIVCSLATRQTTSGTHPATYASFKPSVTPSAAHYVHCLRGSHAVSFPIHFLVLVYCCGTLLSVHPPPYRLHPRYLLQLHFPLEPLITV